MIETACYRFETFLKTQISRRKFLKVILGGLLFLFAETTWLKTAFAKREDSTGRPKKNIKGQHDLVVAEGTDPYKNTIAAIAALGGMQIFVKKGDTVVIKPNIGWDRTPEQAANTNPEVVAALTDLCFKAGAKRVNIFDVTCNDERRCYLNSGIQQAAKAKKANIYFPNHWNVLNARFKYKSKMEGWPVLRDAIECDTFINVPVLKHHGLTRLTLGMKNLMGVCSGVRGQIHLDIGQKLVEITDFIKPELTVIDATRFLTKNGPSGGNLNDVVPLNKVLAGTDPTLTDIYAAQLVKVNPMDVPYLKNAVEKGFGMTDPAKADIFRVTA